MFFFALTLLIAAVFIRGNSITRRLDVHDRSTDFEDNPKPYSLSYKILAKNTGLPLNSRSETSDGFGNVNGSYSISDGFRNFREVHYTASKDGFHAIVHTNEPGTNKQNPANVVMKISNVPLFILKGWTPTRPPTTERARPPRPPPTSRAGVKHSLEKNRGRVVPKK